jgi:hypothetical protein
MPNFATESDVRLKLQLTDPALAAADLIIACIDDAHAEILRFLDDDVGVEPPDAALVTGEALLAGAYVLRALGAKDAVAQREIVIGNQRLSGGQRFRALAQMAAATEQQAWYLLEPYLTERPGRTIAASTDSTPVLGEE